MRPLQELTNLSQLLVRQVQLMRNFQLYLDQQSTLSSSHLLGYSKNLGHIFWKVRLMYQNQKIQNPLPPFFLTNLWLLGNFLDIFFGIAFDNILYPCLRQPAFLCPGYSTNDRNRHKLPTTRIPQILDSHLDIFSPTLLISSN